MAMRIDPCQKPDRQGGLLSQLALPDGRASDTLLLAFGGLAAATYRGSTRDVRVLTRITLADTRSLTAQVTQVIELGATNATFLHHVDVIDNRRVQRKDSLNAHTEAGLADGNRLARAAVLASYADALKCLQTFFGF